MHREKPKTRPNSTHINRVSRTSNVREPSETARDPKTELEQTRMRLLDQTDWVGLAYTRPLKHKFASHSDKQQIAKRRRTRRERRNSQVRNKQAVPNTLEPFVEDTFHDEHYMHGALQPHDDISVHIGHGCENARPLASSAPRSRCSVGSEPSSDVMLFDVDPGQPHQPVDNLSANWPEDSFALGVKNEVRGEELDEGLNRNAPRYTLEADGPLPTKNMSTEHRVVSRPAESHLEETWPHNEQIEISLSDRPGISSERGDLVRHIASSNGDIAEASAGLDLSTAHFATDCNRPSSPDAQVYSTLEHVSKYTHSQHEPVLVEHVSSSHNCIAQESKQALFEWLDDFGEQDYERPPQDADFNTSSGIDEIENDRIADVHPRSYNVPVADTQEDELSLADQQMNVATLHETHDEVGRSFMSDDILSTC